MSALRPIAVPISLCVSLVYWPLFVAISSVSMCVSVVLWLLTCWMGRRTSGRAAHLGAILWGSVTLRINPLWRLTIHHGNAPSPSDGAVYIANHCSQMDILAVAATGRQFKFVSKKSVFWLPIYGWAMFLAGYIPLERGKGESIKRMMDSCRKRLGRGDSVLIFPEGTRSPDGKLQEFRRGAFQLAHDANTPIVPVLIRGSGDALPKGSLLCHTAHIGVTFLETIPAERVASTDSKALCDEVHGMYQRLLDADDNAKQC